MTVGIPGLIGGLQGCCPLSVSNQTPIISGSEDGEIGQGNHKHDSDETDFVNMRFRAPCESNFQYLQAS